MYNGYYAQASQNPGFSEQGAIDALGQSQYDKWKQGDIGIRGGFNASQPQMVPLMQQMQGGQQQSGGMQGGQQSGGQKPPPMGGGQQSPPSMGGQQQGGQRPPPQGGEMPMSPGDNLGGLNPQGSQPSSPSQPMFPTQQMSGQQMPQQQMNPMSLTNLTSTGGKLSAGTQNPQMGMYGGINDFASFFRNMNTGLGA